MWIKYPTFLLGELFCIYPLPKLGLWSPYIYEHQALL